MRTALLLLTLWNPTGSCHWGMFCNSQIQTSGIFLDPELLWYLIILCLNIRTQLAPEAECHQKIFAGFPPKSAFISEDVSAVSLDFCQFFQQMPNQPPHCSLCKWSWALGTLVNIWGCHRWDASPRGCLFPFLPLWGPRIHWEGAGNGTSISELPSLLITWGTPYLVNVCKVN